MDLATVEEEVLEVGCWGTGENWVSGVGERQGLLSEVQGGGGGWLLGFGLLGWFGLLGSSDESFFVLG